jgi:micrococcal nuclease
MAPRLTRHTRRLIRKLGGGVALAIVLVGLVLADRAGLFGRKPAARHADYHNQTFRVVRVVDGDTLDVDAPDTVNQRKTTRIRLWGVDTPETVKPNTPVQHFGPEASAFVKDRCTGQQVRLELDRSQTRDKYKRLLAYVYLPDGRMLNRVLIEEGYGYADPRFDHAYQAEFLRLQDRARRAERGLWKRVKESDLPSYWRGKVDLR